VFCVYLGGMWLNTGAHATSRGENGECAATSRIDGAMSCVSGRTVAFRTEILNNEGFLSAYCSEKWRGKPLNKDDDNFITRYFLSRRMRMPLFTQR
jgi:hypothetical protein